MADIGQEKEAVTKQETDPKTEPAAEQDIALEFVPVSEQDAAPEFEPVEELYEAPGEEPEDKPADPERSARPLTEKEFIREQVRLGRLEWFNEHRTVVFAAIGIVLAALIFLGIHFYNRSNNPATWLAQSFAKDFGTSFDFEAAISEDGEPSMKYKGSAEFDRSGQSIKAAYDADYGRYTYTGALFAGDDKAVKGSYYKDKWIIEDCSEQVRDFFALDKAMQSGRLDSGALLRFLKLTSEYSSEELERFSKRFAGLLSSDSTLATVTAEGVAGGTRYDYEISVRELFDILVEDGAPLFFHSSDYNSFKARYEANRRTLEGKVCRMSFVIDTQGYLAVFEIEIEADDVVYRLDCRMSGFGEAKATLPEGFMKAAGLTETE